MRIVGKSEAIKEIREEVESLARGRKSAVILGEGGVGKGLIAESIHSDSKDSKKACIRINVAALEPDRFRMLIDATIKRGEFFDPFVPDHRSFRLVAGTTLIFEDAERAGFAAQKSLAELLMHIRKEKEEVRSFLLARAPLAQLVRDGSLLRGVMDATKRWEVIKVPPLRDRPEDVPELVEYFVDQIGKELGIQGMVIDSNAIAVLVRQEWKENVQELKRLVERSLVLSSNRDVFQLPEGLVSEQAELTRILDRIEEGTDFALDNSMEIIEKGILLRTLGKFEFNQSRTARFLKMTEDTLRYRMKRLGIPTARKA